MSMFRILSATILLTCSMALSGCSDGGIQELREWMDETRRQTVVAVPKLTEPKKFTPFLYTVKDDLDPYNPVKLSAALAKLKTNTGTGLRPDLERRREPLEAYPLDTLKMVGTLEKPGLSYALIQVEKSVFQAKVGQYIGQNFGMITKITDAEVEIKEIVRDAAGEWTERKATLELQENSK